MQESPRIQHTLPECQLCEGAGKVRGLACICGRPVTENYRGIPFCGRKKCWDTQGVLLNKIAEPFTLEQYEELKKPKPTRTEREAAYDDWEARLRYQDEGGYQPSRDPHQYHRGGRGSRGFGGRNWN